MFTFCRQCLLNSIAHKYVVSNNKELYACFIDFSKAYDLVNRELLWQKLTNYGVSDKFVNYMREIYRKVEACVKLDPQHVTESFSSQLGLRQGDCLSCINFLLYLGDIADYFRSHSATEINIGNLYLTLLMYADDLCIVDTTAKGLRRKINLLAKYCELVGMKINIDKSKTVHFRKSLRTQTNFSWYIDTQPLETVNQYKYLGLYIHGTCSWKSAVYDICLRANRAIMLMFANLKRFGNVPVPLLLKLFDSKIVPILLYGSEVWGLSAGDLPNIEKVANCFYRRILGLKKNTPIALVRGELGRHSMSHLVKCRVVKFWIKLLKCGEHRAIKMVYQYEYHLSQTSRACWATSLKSVLFKMGFGDVWQNQGAGDFEVFHQIYKQRSRDIDGQNWHTLLGDSGNLKIYRVIKLELSIAPFLLLDLSKKVTNCLVRLRGSLLRIGANEGRWKRVPYEQRTCEMCNSGLVDDEIHYLFDCRAWSSFRQPLNQYAVFRTHDLVNIFDCREKSLFTDLFLYVKRTLSFRQEILQTL